MLLRMPLEVRDIFKEFLERDYPDRARHVMSVIRSMRGGKDYDSEWGKRMRGDGPYAWQIGRRFEMAAKRLGLNREKLRLSSICLPIEWPRNAERARLPRRTDGGILQCLATGAVCP